MERYLAIDKKMHIVLGLLIYSSSTHVIGPILAIILTIIVAGGKEIIWDKWLGKGTPDIHDFYATVFIPIILFLYQIYYLYL